MEVVCKAVCGLCEASAPKFCHNNPPFYAKGVALCTPTKGVTPLETDTSHRNTPVRVIVYNEKYSYQK